MVSIQSSYGSECFSTIRDTSSNDDRDASCRRLLYQLRPILTIKQQNDRRLSDFLHCWSRFYFHPTSNQSAICVTPFSETSVFCATSSSETSVFTSIAAIAVSLFIGYNHDVTALVQAMCPYNTILIMYKQCVHHQAHGLVVNHRIVIPSISFANKRQSYIDR